MKRKIHWCGKVIILGVTVCLIYSGCESQTDTGVKRDIQNAVEQVSDEQMIQEKSEELNRTAENNSVEVEEKSDSDVDYDLTGMSSDMVYATVYQMMMNPEDYEGKTFRMHGLYYASYYESTNKYYHFCIIKDAMACCSQGMEFIWEDGSHVYPDEYPKESADITVTGAFETYTEEGDSSLYCRLRDATLER